MPSAQLFGVRTRTILLSRYLGGASERPSKVWMMGARRMEDSARARALSFLLLNNSGRRKERKKQSESHIPTTVAVIHLTAPPFLAAQSRPRGAASLTRSCPQATTAKGCNAMRLGRRKALRCSLSREAARAASSLEGRAAPKVDVWMGRRSVTPVSRALASTPIHVHVPRFGLGQVFRKTKRKTEGPQHFGLCVSGNFQGTPPNEHTSVQ